MRFRNNPIPTDQCLVFQEKTEEKEKDSILFVIDSLWMLWDSEGALKRQSISEELFPLQVFCLRFRLSACLVG